MLSIALLSSLSQADEALHYFNGRGVVDFAERFETNGSRFDLAIEAGVRTAPPPLQELTDPIPASIPKGLSLKIEDVLRLPDTRNPPGVEKENIRANRARINVMRRAPDNRLFANDLRGPLYVISDHSVQTYLNMHDEFPNLRIGDSFPSGFVSFALHPNFANNGKFYTIHTEFATGKPVDFRPSTQNIAIQSHVLLCEWTATFPSADTFAGNRRIILRIGIPQGGIHGAGDVSFNPVAKPGEADYGLLYVTVGDNLLFSLGHLDQIGRQDSIFGAIIRIDPSGNNAKNGRYGIPRDNPFVGQADAVGEVYAYGFRNPHRLAWDEQTGTRYIFDIGENNIEEVNILHAGANYGWPAREGTFAVRPRPNDKRLTMLPRAETSAYHYPVAQYDHDEGIAIANGEVYRGSDTPELFGKLIFGDIKNGRIFYADADALLRADDGDISTMAPIEELQLRRNGADVTLYDVVNEAIGGEKNNPHQRTDLRIGLDARGEILITTKMDGYIRRLTR